jgi:hypothetical protein
MPPNVGPCPMLSLSLTSRGALSILRGFELRTN